MHDAYADLILWTAILACCFAGWGAAICIYLVKNVRPPDVRGTLRAVQGGDRVKRFTFATHIAFSTILAVFLVWILGGIALDICLRLMAATVVVLFLYAGVASAVDEYKKRKHQREFHEALNAIMENALKTAIAKGPSAVFTVAIADEPIAAGDLVQLKDGRVTKKPTVN